MSREVGKKNTPREEVEELMKKHREGMTKRELSEKYQKPIKTIGKMITRENNKRRQIESGLAPQKSGSRETSDKIQEYQQENRRRKMENELLRNFLHLAGRK